MQAMIFAAGLGSRLKPLTDYQPKALVKVRNKTLLEHAIVKLKNAGVTRIIVNTHHFSDQIIAFLWAHDFGMEILISDESDCLRDTGGGLKHAQKLLEDKPLIVYNVDIFTDLNISEAYNDHLISNPLATIVVRHRETTRYFLFDQKRRLCGWENILTGEQKISIQKDGLVRYAFSGIHIIDPEIFSLMPDQDVFSIVDLYLNLAKDHLINAYIDTSEHWVDLGKIEQLDKLNNTPD